MAGACRCCRFAPGGGRGMRIVIAAVTSLQPFAPGIVWDWIHLADGFRRLGHDVLYVEEVEPSWCVDANGKPCPFEVSSNRQLFRSCMERFGLMEHACQIFNRGEMTFGMSRNELLAHAKGADLLVNISGHAKSDLILGSAARRAYVDQDPVYTQLWKAEYGKDIGFSAHDVFFSVGLNIGTSSTHIPDCGLKWHPMLPPVVLDYWPINIDSSCSRFTTIASWSAYSDLCYAGEWYGGKSTEFARFAELPKKSGQECEVAARQHDHDQDGMRLLHDGEWKVTEASRITDLDNYQRYIAGSRAEIGIAKNSYVKGRSGWFSDRASHYLASGKPVLAQGTGFERHVPTGQGLLAFNTMAEAVDGVASINADYASHCRAARRFAADYLDYTKILPRMLDVCGTSPIARLLK